MRTFYISNRRRYNLDQALKQYEADKESDRRSSNDGDMESKLIGEVVKTTTEPSIRTIVVPKTLPSIASNSTTEDTTEDETTDERSPYAVAATGAIASNLSTKAKPTAASTSAASLFSNPVVDSGEVEDVYCQETKKHGTSSVLEDVISTITNAARLKESANLTSKMRETNLESTGVVSVTSEEDSSLEFNPIDANKTRHLDSSDNIASIKTQKMRKNFDMKENNVSKVLSDNDNEVLEGDEEDDDDDDVMEV